MPKVELTEKLMQEIGLEIDSNHCIVDQDNGSRLQFNGKNLKYIEDGIRTGRNDLEFNPVENSKLMNHLFSYYTNKIHQEDGRYINIYYPVECAENKGFIELKDGDNNIMRSGEYYNDSLKYADLIFQLNGEEDVDLSEYDSKRPPIEK